MAGAELPPLETSAFVFAMVSGMLMGRRFAHRLPSWQIQRGFALLLLAVAIQMMIKAMINWA